MAAKASCQVTIADITDAYSAVLTSETYTFMGNTSGAPIGSACTTQAMAYQGNIRCSKVTIGTISCPTGISASVSNNGTASPTITFKTTAVISVACEASVPVIVDGLRSIRNSHLQLLIRELALGGILQKTLLNCQSVLAHGNLELGDYWNWNY